LAPHYITDQLIDTIDLEIVPFGKATKIVNETDGSFTFDCQHGEQECWGNQLHVSFIIPNTQLESQFQSSFIL